MQHTIWIPGAAFLKVPRKILGKLLMLGVTDTQVATSSRGYSATVEHCTNRPINSLQRSNRKLYSSSNNSSSKIKSCPKIFLGTFENAAPGHIFTSHSHNVFTLHSLVFDECFYYAFKCFLLFFRHF